MDHQFDLYNEEGDEHQDPTYIETDSDEVLVGEPLKEIDNHPSIRKTLGSKISEKINNDVLKKPFKLPTKKKSGSDELFIEENLNDDDSMPNIIIKGDNNSINVNINYNNAL
nr:1755_t:CDS:2 [Entrophospora candida]